MKSLRKFEHINACSVDEAVSILRRFGESARITAGGTDLIGTLRFEILPYYPQVVINLKTIPGLDFIKEEDGLLKIGALTRLEDIATNPVIKSRYTALSEAAHRTASPHVREMGTIGGNICQLIRCWYFRKEDNRFNCIRKGGAMCHAVVGDNRYHSIFGAVRVGPPPCTSDCLAGNDIPSVLESIRAGDLSRASRILLNTNPIPAITGRVCPHYCEQNCNRSEFGQAVSIRSIERFVGDYILEHAEEFFVQPECENNKQVAVVGSGPAGLSAAYFLRKLGYSVTVYEALEEGGGILYYGIPPYRLPGDIIKKQIKAIENTGVKFKFNVTVGKDIALDRLQKEYEAVFLATGAWKQPSLGIPDEELLTSGLDFLFRVNSGQRNIPADRVLVIGGGSVAMDVAITARRLGVKEVTVSCLESESQMPALREDVEQAVREGIRILSSWGPHKILKENGKLTGMELVRCTSVFNTEGRFSPSYDYADTRTVEADQIILAIGQKPDLAYAMEPLKVERGLISVSAGSQATSLPGVYAGGDATISGTLSVVAAVASGRRAAESINQYLGGQGSLKIEQKIDHLTRINGDILENFHRIQVPRLSPSEVSLDKEDIPELSLEPIEMEAGRCFNCGCDGVNPSDIAPALVALNARIVTSKRTIGIDNFWAADKGFKPTVLDDDEIITEIQIPQPGEGTKSSFIKFALRKSIDFPIVNCAAALECENGVVRSARICLNAVYSNPYRATGAEEAITGKVIDEDNAENAGIAAVSNAVSLAYNKFKIQIAKTMVKRAILACK